MATPQEIRHRLMNPPNAVPDRPIAMHNGRPVDTSRGVVVELFIVKQSINKPVDDFPILQPNRHDRWPRYFCPQEGFRVSGLSIKRHVARHFNITVPELESIRKTKRIVRIRHIAMWLAKTLTSLSLPAIGRALGGRAQLTGELSR